MHSLSPSTALGGDEPRVDNIGSITITEVPFVAIASVAARLGGEKATATALKSYIGAAAPDAGKSLGKAPLLAFWTGPDQWMVTAPMETHELIADDLTAKVKGKASITEQSGAWVQFDVEGDGKVDMFERLSALPIRNMVAGDANRTRIEQLGCFVLHHGEKISILGPRASTGSLHHALLAAATSIS